MLKDKMLECPALTTIGVIGGKWKTRVLWLLRGGGHSFGELRSVLPGVSAKVLSEQLQQLQADGIVTAQEDRRGAVTFVVYSYTDYGRTLIPALDALGAWGMSHDATPPASGG